jgi:hypothetical protein
LALDFDLIHRLRVSAVCLTRRGDHAVHRDRVARQDREATAWARAPVHRRGGRIVPMTGDGELREGQIWESLQPCANERLSEIIAVVGLTSCSRIRRSPR